LKEQLAKIIIGLWDFAANKMRNCFGCRPKQWSFNIANCIVLDMEGLFFKAPGIFGAD
jgi:hypothetical protein